MLVFLNDSAYVDANRWEQLISQHIPYLHKFELKHYVKTGISQQIAEYPKLHTSIRVVVLDQTKIEIKSYNRPETLLQ